MQINTIHKLQYALDTSKKVIKFVWRHALTLIVVGMMLNVVQISTANWKNIVITLLITQLLDRFKIKIKFYDGAYNLAQEQMFESARRNSAWAMNPTQTGSPAWNMDPFAPGSSAYYTRNQTNYY
jgi:hypothetical protein